MVKLSTRSPILISLYFIALNLISLGTAILLLQYFPAISPFVVFIPTVLIVTWYAGFLPGLLTALISTVSILSLFFFPSNRPLLLAEMTIFIEFFLFFTVSLAVSYMLDKSKNQEVITNYQKQLRQNKHLIETLEKNYENAQKEIQARDQFLAIASHELKTPVTSMLLQVQNAIHNIRNVSLANFSVENLLKMLESTELQSQRLSKMVNDLLNLSLITTGKLDLEPEETDLTEITKQVTENFSEKLKKEHTSITVHADKPVVGMWDKVRIAQAVTNLLSNAIKYGNNKPIAVTVTNSHQKAKLVVQDNGIGIAPDQQQKIFERFERAVSPKDYQGLGVGLYITNQIVKAHNGKISVDSKPHNGTSFTIELPLKTQN
jgi:signal transduction histidine kinase